MLMPNPAVQPLIGLEYRRWLAVNGDKPAPASCASPDLASVDDMREHRSAKRQDAKAGPVPFDPGYRPSPGQREARHIGITCSAPKWIANSTQFELIVGAWIDGWPEISEEYERWEEQREDSLTPIAAALEAAEAENIGKHIARIYRLTGVWIEPKDRLCIDDDSGEVRPMLAGDYDAMIREIKCDLANWRSCA